MALIPVQGQPGVFKDSDTGKVFSISDFREDNKYDTVAIPAGLIAAGSTARFYTDLASKLAIDTNFTQVSRLSAGEEMIIERVGIYIHTCVGNLIAAVPDIKRIADDMFVRFEVNQKVLVEGPAHTFPSGYGLAGSETGGAGIVSIGVPSTAAQSRLKTPQLITGNGNHEVVATCTFQARDWLAVTTNAFGAAAAPVAAADRPPTFTGPMLVKAYLHGLIRSAVSR